MSDNTLIINNQEVIDQEDKELDDLLVGGITEVFDCLKDDLVTQKEKETELANKLDLVKESALFGFEQTVEQFKTSHMKNLNTLLEEEKTRALTKEEMDSKTNSILAINGINELNENKIIESYLSTLSSDSYDELLNHYKIKIKLDKLIHTARRLKIKTDNIKPIFDMVTKIPNKEFKNKITLYINLFLDSLSNLPKDTLYSRRYYLVFQIGLIRLSLQSMTTFINLERFYASIFNIEFDKNSLKLKDYTNSLKEIQEQENVS